jgi:hypothetical protein
MQMSDPGISDANEDLVIYERLAKVWEFASIDRKVSFREAVFIPIKGEYAPVGAAMFIAVLCFPEDAKKQYEFIKAIGAALVKQSSKPKSKQRQELRGILGFAELLDLPNKRIEQTINDGLSRLHKRFRAAWVLLPKFSSNANPDNQSSLRDIVLVAAKQNTHAYPAFGSREDDVEQIFTSFRQRVMTPSKPVVHLAMSLYGYVETGKPNKTNILKLVQTANNWLSKVVEQAECYRVMFGDLFPRRDSKYLPTRAQNFDAPPSETIALLPYIDPIPPTTGWPDLMKLRIKGHPP